jgi:hypothetical protein
MFGDLIDATLLIAAGLALAALAPHIKRAVLRLDKTSRDRIAQEQTDRTDRFAHFRHTLDVAAEQVEDVGEVETVDPRTGTPVTRYLFEGTAYASRDEAERVRAEKIGTIARAFYRDLPRALLEKRGDGRLN